MPPAAPIHSLYLMAGLATALTVTVTAGLIYGLLCWWFPQRHLPFSTVHATATVTTILAITATHDTYALTTATALLLITGVFHLAEHLDHRDHDRLHPQTRDPEQPG